MIRKCFSRPRRGLQYEKTYLDISYITEKIIAGCYPGSGLKAIIRNPRKKLNKYLQEHYGDHYYIFNLCAEDNYQYDIKDFSGRVFNYPCVDHYAPTLISLVKFVKHVKNIFTEDSEAVIYVHCLAGKGRTGVFICCLLFSLYPDKSM